MAMKVEKCIKLGSYVNSYIIRSNLVHQKFLHNGPDTLDELLERHVVKKEKSYDNDQEEFLRRQRLTSTRREALGLYRDILRATRFFMWPNSHGILWRDILRENARKEFEEARFEKDPEIITILLIGGSEAVQAALDKVVEKQKQECEKPSQWRWQVRCDLVPVCDVLVDIMVHFLRSCKYKVLLVSVVIMWN